MSGGESQKEIEKNKKSSGGRDKAVKTHTSPQPFIKLLHLNVRSQYVGDGPKGPPPCQNGRNELNRWLLEWLYHGMVGFRMI